MGLPKERMLIDLYFISIANEVKKRSTCIRREVGCVIVKNGHIISCGYNGAPSRCEHCTDESCVRTTSGKDLYSCKGAHAEQNAIAFAARHGVSTEGSTIYCNLQPCSMCAKSIINAGIKRVVFVEKYNDNLSLNLFKEAGVEVLQKNVN